MSEVLVFAVTLGIALASLLSTGFLFRYLESSAEGEGFLGSQRVRYGGAVAGFVIVFSLLFGTYYTLKKLLVRVTPINLNGEWDMILTTNSGDTRKGRATIRQHPGSADFDIIGQFENIENGVHMTVFSSRLGGIRDRTIYYVYENIDKELGVAYGDVQQDIPPRFFLNYADLIGFDRNQDPAGRIEFLRN